MRERQEEIKKRLMNKALSKGPYVRLFLDHKSN